MNHVLEIQGLSKKYEGFTLADVSFSVPQGYIMGLVGPNGAGKTTIIKMILNLVRKDAGQVKIFGLDHLVHEVEVKERIGFVHEAPAFIDYLTLKQIKSIIAPFYRTWDDPMFHKVAGEFALPLGKKFQALSRGTKMKFAIALALSHQADFIIMDEPTSGLDPVFRREFLERLSALLQDERKSVMFSTHLTSDLERIADYITFIQEGRIVFSAPKDEITESWGIVKGGLELLNGRTNGLFRGCRRSEFGFEALTDNVAEARRRFGPAVVVEKASLEDIVYYSAKGEGND